MKRSLLLLPLAALLVGSDADPPGTEVVVVFNHLRFEPASVEVRLGTRVTFHNMAVGEGTSTIVAADGSFRSPRLASRGEWSHRFTTRGEHGYFLEEHPATKGNAIVR
jgi:plastocyanin